jgi:Na+/H+-translocating membrane pyrophosphatase
MSGLSLPPGFIAVVVALVVGVAGGALNMGFSAISASLLGVATTAVSLWAFVSEP